MKIKETITIMDCQEVLNRHRKKKGKSWKTCDIDFLREKLEEEIQEWKDIPFGQLEEEYNELIDIINVATMLAERLRDG